MKSIIQNNSKMVQNGYTLFFAIITSTIVLGVAVFILSISRGQYLLASTARESTIAFYAADSGFECAVKVAPSLVEEIKKYAPSVPFNCAITSSSNNIEEFKKANVLGLTDALQTSEIPIDLGSDRCALVVITKGTYIDPTTGVTPITIIRSRGYNYCTRAGTTLGPDITNPKVVERLVRLTIKGL